MQSTDLFKYVSVQNAYPRFQLFYAEHNHIVYTDDACIARDMPNNFFNDLQINIFDVMNMLSTIPFLFSGLCLIIFKQSSYHRVRISFACVV